MRRILLVLVVLSALGLFTANASTFTTTANDIASFSTSTSFTTPTTNGCMPVLLQSPIDVRTVAGVDQLTLAGSVPGNAAQVTRPVQGSGTPLSTQAAAGAFLAWPAPAAVAPCGYRLLGSVTLLVQTNGDGTADAGRDRLSTGLFDCPSGATQTVVSADPDTCTLVDSAVAPAASGQNATFKDRLVSFGPVDHTFDPGRQLRLKIVNGSVRTITLPPVGTITLATSWDVRWVHNANHRSQLVFS